jgi:hypothetical protein
VILNNISLGTDQIAEIPFGVPYDEPADVVIPDGVMQQYLGTFHQAEKNVDLTILKQEQYLYAVLSNPQDPQNIIKFRLRAVGPGEFNIADDGGKIVFTRDSSGAFNSFELRGGPAPRIFQRIAP